MLTPWIGFTFLSQPLTNCMSICHLPFVDVEFSQAALKAGAKCKSSLSLLVVFSPFCGILYATPINSFH